MLRSLHIQEKLSQSLITTYTHAHTHTSSTALTYIHTYIHTQIQQRKDVVSQSAEELAYTRDAVSVSDNYFKADELKGVFGDIPELLPYSVCICMCIAVCICMCIVCICMCIVCICMCIVCIFMCILCMFVCVYVCVYGVFGDIQDCYHIRYVFVCV